MLPAPATAPHSRLTTSLLFCWDMSERAAHHGRPVFCGYRSVSRYQAATIFHRREIICTIDAINCNCSP